MKNTFVFKKVISAVLLVTMLATFVGCKNTEKKDGKVNTDAPSVSMDSGSSSTARPNSTDDVGTNDDVIWEDDNNWGSDIEENPPKKEEDVIVGTVTKSDFADTITYANSIANGIQAKYTGGKRDVYEITNKDTVLTETLYSTDVMGTTLKNKNGVSYFKNQLDVYAVDGNGEEYNVLPSISNAKINTTKLGYYYYDVNVRDLYMSYTSAVSYPDVPAIDFTPSLWHTNDMGDPYTNSNGNFTVKVSDTHDPFFYQTGFDVDGSKVNAVEVTLKIDDNSSHGVLYYYTSDIRGFNADQLSVFNMKTDGEFHTYVIPVDNNGKNIAGVRFDLGTTVGATVTIKSARFAYMRQPETPIAVEKTFHSYPDKMHFEASVLATADTLPVKNIKEYGYKVTFEKSDVLSIVIGIDGKAVAPEIFKVYQNPEYIGIDIKNAGIVGFVIPNDGTKYGLKLSENATTYTLYVFNRISKTINFGSPVSLSSRIYTDTSHSFDGLKNTSKLERNPYTQITVRSSKNGAFVGYDYAFGAYIFSVRGTDFNSAYEKKNRNVYYASDISITASDDRVIYVSMYTTSGGLEGAAISTSKDVGLPIPIEVCKNFKGEIEEPIYDPADDSYGYSILPLKTSKNTKYEFTLYHLYQNWGKFPLKQISSISFHVSYYHLSTGVTESNCIAPYYVYGRDGWTLPDFRGCSGEIWSSQPQFNSVGRLYFTKHKDSEGNVVMSEYTDSDIRSSGNTYADMDYSYVADDGSYKHTLRHFELPQTDENRTMYELSLEFLKDTTFGDVKNDLSMFSFDGRSVTFSKASYLAADGTSKVVTNSNTSVKSEVYGLSKNSPYFSYYDFKLRDGDPTSGMNFGLVVRDYSVSLAGKKWNGNLVFKNEFDGNLNIGTLSLNLGKTTFKKGDTISLTMILLPYGLPEASSYTNLQYVIEDFVKYPFSLTAEKGSVTKDAFLPSVKCVDNEAIVTAKGGRNNQVVKATGYTTLGVPKIYEKINGKWQEYDYHVKGDYDGYSVQYENGQYSYSFVCDMGNNPQTAQRTFKIVIE